MPINGLDLSDGDLRAQKEWVFKLKSTVTLLARSAAQAQRNFDQYLTAMEHVAALYKDYGALLSDAKAPYLSIEADIPNLRELKQETARMHSFVHKWEHCQSLHSVRRHLHTQTEVLKSRSVLASRALDSCMEREALISDFIMKNAKLERRLKKQSPEAAQLQQQCDALKRRIFAVHKTSQRDVENVAVKSSGSLHDLTMQFFKGMYKNGRYVEKHFHPQRTGIMLETGESFVNLNDDSDDDAVTGMFHPPRTPQSEMSSVAPSAVYGQNRSAYAHPEAPHSHVDPRGAPQNSGIPLRYEADAAVNTTAATSADR